MGMFSVVRMRHEKVLSLIFSESLIKFFVGKVKIIFVSDADWIVF